MCRAYNIPVATYRDRQSKGYSLAESLSTTSFWECADHLGNKYESLSVMCEAYGITKAAYLARLGRGWTVERALTVPAQQRHYSKSCPTGKPSKDHLGNEYPSIAHMAKAYGLPYYVVRRRLKAGWDIKKTLTTPAIKRR